MKILQILVLIFGLAVFVNAQGKVTLLSGIVYNLNKSVLSLTAVTVTGSNKLIYKTITDEKGFYRIWLPIGK